jgi:hypothetical protein
MWLRFRSKYNALWNGIAHSMRVPASLRPWLPRVAIAAVLVFACYRFEWHWLRNITASIIVRLSRVLALPVNQPAPDVMEMNGTHYVCYISCTMIDVFCAASALMWNAYLPFLRNVLRLVYLFFFVFALNILRLEVDFQLVYHFQTPSIVGHEILGGIAYFIVLIMVVETREKGVQQNKPGQH